MRLFNTLTRKIEEFKPLNSLHIGMYTCGPTVYDRMHIGNLRTFLLSDILGRTLKYLGYQLVSVQNITDIDDKIIKRAKKERLSIEAVTKRYTEDFINDMNKLNMQLVMGQQPKATEYIEKIIQYVEVLLNKGYAYVEKDGSVYFDISKFPGYGKLSRLEKDQLRTGTRTLSDEYTKEDVQDFALWKATPDEEEGFKFKSPWSFGRPGWHIECSVMSQSSLGDTFDIHVGGVDLIFPHHENEIAQSEAKTGKSFVKYFIHGEHMLVDGKKMSKSLGNTYTLSDVIEKGIEPTALRLLFLQAHYRQQLNFTWAAAKGAQEAYNRLKNFVLDLRHETQRTQLSAEKLSKIDRFRADFKNALENDLQTPQAVAVMWEVLKSSIPVQDKLDLLLEFDQVLGLELQDVETEKIPQDVIKLAEERLEARKKGDFQKSDELRKQILAKGYIIEDTDEGYRIKKS